MGGSLVFHNSTAGPRVQARDQLGVSAVPFAIDVWISTASMRKFTQNKGALLPVMGVPLHDVVFQRIFLVPVFSVFVQLFQQLFSIILLFFLIFISDQI